MRNVFKPAGLRVEYDIKVPMRDGVNLSLDVYFPLGEGPWPVILIRTPYNNQMPIIVTESATYFAAERLRGCRTGRAGAIRLGRRVRALGERIRRWFRYPRMDREPRTGATGTSACMARPTWATSSGRRRRWAANT